MKTPKDISVHLSKNKGKEIYQLEYSQILEIQVGSLKNNKKGTQIFEVHIGLWVTLYWFPSGIRMV